MDKFNSQKAFTGFSTNISWESAKDQFISMLDRQRRQKKKGSFASKLDAINAKIDGMPGSDEVLESKKSRISYEMEERHRKFPRKMPGEGILLDTHDPNQASVEIGEVVKQYFQ